MGELAARDGLPRAATVRAVTVCVTWRIAGAAFRELVRQTPDLLEDLFWQQVDRVRRLSRQIL